MAELMQSGQFWIIILYMGNPNRSPPSLSSYLCNDEKCWYFGCSLDLLNMFVTEKNSPFVLLENLPSKGLNLHNKDLERNYFILFQNANNLNFKLISGLLPRFFSRSLVSPCSAILAINKHSSNPYFMFVYFFFQRCTLANLNF